MLAASFLSCYSCSFRRFAVASRVLSTMFVGIGGFSRLLMAFGDRLLGASGVSLALSLSLSLLLAFVVS